MDNYKVFLILGGLKPITRVPKTIFFAKNYDMAKLYFQGWLYGEKNPENYKLYKIAEINEKIDILQDKIFIAGGYEINQKQKEDKLKINQEKLLIEKTKNENIEKQIEMLFGGTVINEQRR